MCTLVIVYSRLSFTELGSKKKKEKEKDQRFPSHLQQHKDKIVFLFRKGHKCVTAI